MGRIRGNYILVIGLALSTASSLLFAVPIPTSTSYWAYGFPAMVFAGIGADTVYPCLGLFTTQTLPRKDQSVAGAMFQTFGRLGQAMFLPITSTVQYQVQMRSEHDGSEECPAFLKGIRVVHWFCAGCVGFSLFLTIGGLGNMGKIGLVKKLGTAKPGSVSRKEGEPV